MRLFSKILVVAAALAVAGCSGPDRFGAGGGSAAGGPGLGAGAGAGGVIPGSVNDPTSTAYFQQAVGDRVLFAVDQSTLSTDAQITLDGQIAWLANNPDYQAVIEGHADEQGTREYNLALSARRANAVIEYLVAGGIAQSRLTPRPMGKERPAALCSEESCYAQNRRSVTVLAASGLTG